MKLKKRVFGVFYFLAIVISSNLKAYCQVDALVNIKNAEQVITVGGPDADISGFSSSSIQIAIDAIKSRGGGMVKLFPGVYVITAPVRLSDNITLSGEGESTILRKSDGFKTSFIVDADWGMLKAKVSDVNGFQKGTGIELYDDEHDKGWGVTTAVITDIIGNTIYFDNNTVNDYLASLNGTVSNACSVIEGTNVENISISNLTVQGNKSTNDYINGCRGGGIYLFKAKNCLVENVKVNDFNGDSFSWQITENISVKNCEASNGGGLGFHPGTGSDHSVVEGCKSHNNKEDGIFLCWRVQNGVFRNNQVYNNGRYGVSIGHKDTDNIFENNHVFENGLHGVYFRDENEQNGGDRNTFMKNIVENNGISQKSYGFYIDGETHDINLRGNIIRTTPGGKGNQIGAVFVGKKASLINISENSISGSKETVYEKK